MSDLQINWKEKISENQQFRSTWRIEINGKEYIAKKIETDNDAKLEALVKRLKQQVRLSEILNDDEQKKICLFESCYDGKGFVAFVRSFRDGISLDKSLANKRYTVSEAVNLILEIARIVQIAHEHKVFHGDLKPSNIIIGDTGEVSIIDWDTMRISDEVKVELIGTDVTMEQVSGTPQYMPVEQFQGAKITQQSDIYALGVILYQILTGETPFDSVGAQTPTQMAIYKQNHEPDSILVKYPALGIPADLGKIIEEALKNDLNQRIQSVDVFIQRLETIGKITASSAESLATSGPRQTYVVAKEKGKEHKLVLIGHTGAGKTVLAAGLYATQDRDFAVDDPGSKTQTGIHAINTKTIIEDGHWPAATSVGDITNLKFKINYKGKEEAISFDEYAGERLNMENYDKVFLGQLDGAFILLNPGGKQWYVIRDKNSLLADMKHYIDLLSKKANRPPVALVITASDRLESDLKDFSDTFMGYVEELKISLEVHKCKYEVFKVSVSGPLENQEKPHLKPQYIKEPFIWLLKQFTHRERIATTKKVIVAASIALGVLVAGALGEWGREAYNASSIHSDFMTCQRNYNAKKTKSEDDIIAYRNSLVELRLKWCSMKHFSNTKRLGKCADSCMPKFIYSPYRDKFSKDVIALETAIDSINGEYFRRKLQDALELASTENRKVSGWITDWIPLQQNGLTLKQELKVKSDREMPLAVERFDTDELVENFNKLIQNRDVSFPAELATLYSKWLSSKSVLSVDERKNNEEKLSGLNLQAKKAVALRAFEDDVSIYERKINDFSGGIPPLSALVKDFMEFKRKEVIDVSTDTVNEAYNKLQNSLYAVIEKEIEKLCITFRDQQMNGDQFAIPAFVNEIKKQVLRLIPYEKEKEFALLLDNKIQEVQTAWLQAQERKVDEFIASIQWKSAADALDGLKGYVMDNRNNPYLRKVENKVLEIVGNEMDFQLKNFSHTEAAYRSMRELCAKIRNTTSTYMQNTVYYRFACKYCAWMESSPTHTVTITGIQACSSYNEGAYIYTCEYGVAANGSKLSGWRNIIKDCETVFYSSWVNLPQFYSVSATCKPWDYFLLDFSPYKNIEWAIDRRLEYRVVKISPGIRTDALWVDGKQVEKNDGYAEISFDRIYLRIYFTVTGKRIWDIVKEAKDND